HRTTPFTATDIIGTTLDQARAVPRSPGSDAGAPRAPVFGRPEPSPLLAHYRQRVPQQRRIVGRHRIRMLAVANNLASMPMNRPLGRQLQVEGVIGRAAPA